MFNPADLAYKEKSSFKKKLPKVPEKMRKPLLMVGAVLGGILFPFIIASFIINSQDPPRAAQDEVADQAMRQEIDQLQQEQEDLIQAVDKQIPLPKNEEPMFATVSDKDALKTQEFFGEAENGDRILMYPKNKKAFLYRPSIQKVLAVAPLQYGDEAVAGTSSATLEDPLPPGKAIGPGRVIVEPGSE